MRLDWIRIARDSMKMLIYFYSLFVDNHARARVEYAVEISPDPTWEWICLIARPAVVSSRCARRVRRAALQRKGR